MTLSPDLDKREIWREVAYLLMGLQPREAGRRRAAERSLLTTEVDCENLNKALRARAGLELAEGDIWEVIRALLGRDLEPSKEVLAARYLLAIADDYPDEREITRGKTIGMLRQVKHISKIDEYSANAPLRREAAALVLGTPSGKNLKLVRDLDGREHPSAPLQPVVRAVLEAIDAGATTEGLSAVHGSRPSASTPSPTLGEALRAESTGQADQLDRAPSYYPPELRPTTLWEELSYSFPRRDPNGNVAEDQQGVGASRYVLSVAFENDRRMVILGNPGSGKSTVLAAGLASHLRLGGVGLLANLTTVSEEIEPGPLRLAGVASAILRAHARERQYRVPREDEVDGHLAAALEHDPTFLLCLDGLDEVEDAHALERIRELLHWLSDVPGRIILTSRLTGYVRGLEDANEVILNDLHAPVEFLRRWHPDEESAPRQRVEWALHRSLHLQSLIRIPLFAGMVASIAEQEDVPLMVGSLYRRYLLRFLERGWKPPRARRYKGSEVAAQLELAQDVAFAMATSASGPGERVGPWLSTTTPYWLHSTFSDRGPQIDALLQTDGLLSAVGVRRPGTSAAEQPYSWLHRTFQEHLVGSYLARTWRQDRPRARQLLAHAFGDTRLWGNSLVHLVSLTSRLDNFDLADDLSEASESTSAGDLPSWAKQYTEEMWTSIVLARADVD